MIRSYARCRRNNSPPCMAFRPLLFLPPYHLPAPRARSMFRPESPATASSLLPLARLSGQQERFDATIPWSRRWHVCGGTEAGRHRSSRDPRRPAANTGTILWHGQVPLALTTALASALLDSLQACLLSYPALFFRVASARPVEISTELARVGRPPTARRARQQRLQTGRRSPRLQRPLLVSVSFAPRRYKPSSPLSSPLPPRRPTSPPMVAAPETLVPAQQEAAAVPRVDQAAQVNGSVKDVAAARESEPLF